MTDDIDALVKRLRLPDTNGLHDIDALNAADAIEALRRERDDFQIAVQVYCDERDAAIALLCEADAALEPLAEKHLYPDDIGEPFAANLRAEEDWSEEENDALVDDVWIERRWIRKARDTLAKIRERTNSVDASTMQK